MTLEWIRIKNIFSFGPESQTLNLADPGLYLVMGRNETIQAIKEDDASSSNGSGKSSILDCVSIAFFGRSTKDDVTIERIVNEIQKADGEIELSFMADDGMRYIIERHFRKGGKNANPLYLFKGDNSPANLISEGDKKDTQAKIDEIIKFNYKSFINAIMFSQEQISGFLQDDPAKKKEVIENILQYNILTKYGEIAQKKRKVLTTKLNTAKASAENTKALIANVLTSIDSYLASCEKQKSEGAELIKQFTAEIATIDAVSIEEERAKLVLRQEKLKSIEAMEANAKTALFEFNVILENINSVLAQKTKLEEKKAALSTTYYTDEIAKIRETLGSYLAKCKQDKINHAKLMEESQVRLTELQAIDVIAEKKKQAESVINNLRINDNNARIKSILREMEIEETRVVDLNIQIAGYEKEELDLVKKRDSQADYLDLLKRQQDIGAEIDKALQNPETCPVCDNAINTDDLNEWVNTKKQLIAQLGSQIDERNAARKEINERIAKASVSAVELVKVVAELQLDIEKLSQERKNLQTENAAVPTIEFMTESDLANIEIEKSKLMDKLADKNKEFIDKLYTDSLMQNADENKKSIKRVEADIIELDKEIASLTTEKIDNQLAQKKQEREAIQLKIDEETKNLPQAMEESELIKLESKKKILEDKIISLQEKEYVNPEYISGQEKQKQLHETSLQNIQVDIKALSKKVIMTQFWENALSSKKNSLKSWCINTIIAFLNDKVRYYVDRFFDGSVSVVFDTELNETITCYENDRVYGQFSGGEKRRLNIAILFALNELIKTNLSSSKLNVMFLDEVLGNYLDERGVSTILDILQEKRDEDGAAIYVVEHKDSFKEYPYFQHITVVKGADNYSRIEQ
jgi:DNA repair exonuclease SbcCD ATPase subunit